MFIKIDKDGSLLQISSVWENGFLDNEFDIDMEKFMFCKIEKRKIVYDEQAYLKMLNDKEKSISIYNEINIVLVDCETYGITTNNGKKISNR